MRAATSGGTAKKRRGKGGDAALENYGKEDVVDKGRMGEEVGGGAPEGEKNGPGC